MIFYPFLSFSLLSGAEAVFRKDIEIFYVVKNDKNYVN